jgi:hypothetical protein
VAESIGMFSMSYFMLAKHSFVKLNENVIVWHKYYLYICQK